MDLYDYIFVIVGGFVAGGINTLAGYGSVITLSILMDTMGLPPNIANYTNRVNVTANVMAGSYGYFRSGKLKVKNMWPYIIIVFVGAILGGIAAMNISNDQFRNLYRVLIVFVGVLLVINPKKWLNAESVLKKTNWWITVPLLFVLGFYGGLIQLGIGVFILAILVLFVGKEMIEANALKLFIIMFYSIFLIGMFHYKGLIDWKAGSSLAVSQALGSYITAIYASKIKNAHVWAYRLLILIVFFIIGREIYLYLA